MASDAAERCAEVLRAGARGPEGAEARARAVALAEEVGHARPSRTTRTTRPNGSGRGDGMRHGTRAMARERDGLTRAMDDSYFSLRAVEARGLSNGDGDVSVAVRARESARGETFRVRDASRIGSWTVANDE